MAKTAPADYSLLRLINSLASPLSGDNIFERRIGDAVGAPRTMEGRVTYPGWQFSGTAPLPSRALARALGAQGSAASGGDLVTSSVMQVAEAARPALVFDEIGAIRTELTENTGAASYPAWNPEQQAGAGRWVGEGSQGTNVLLTLKDVTATPRSALSFIKYTRQLSNQAPLLEAALQAEMQRSVESVLERGFLRGRGGREPFGLCLVAEIKGTVTPWGSSTPTFAELVQQAKAYTAAKAPWKRAHWIMSSDMALDLATTEKATGTAQFVLETASGRPTILGRPVAITDHMPDDRILLVNPDVIRHVYWGPPFLLVDKYSDNMDIRGEAMIVVDNFCDLVVEQPQQICVGGDA